MPKWQKATTCLAIFGFLNLVFNIPSIPKLLAICFFDNPVVEYSITSLPSNYDANTIVDGVNWEKNYKKYILEIENKSEKVGVFDLRVELDMPTPSLVIKNEVLEKLGGEDISINQGYSEIGIGGEAKLNQQIPNSTNNLKINIGKLFPSGKIQLLIIESFMGELDNGLIVSNYRYLNAMEKAKKISSKYEIVVKNSKEKLLYVDMENPIFEKIERKLFIGPTPIVDN